MDPSSTGSNSVSQADEEHEVTSDGKLMASESASFQRSKVLEMSAIDKTCLASASHQSNTTVRARRFSSGFVNGHCRYSDTRTSHLRCFKAFGDLQALTMAPLHDRSL